MRSDDISQARDTPILISPHPLRSSPNNPPLPARHYTPLPPNSQPHPPSTTPETHVSRALPPPVSSRARPHYKVPFRRPTGAWNAPLELVIFDARAGPIKTGTCAESGYVAVDFVSMSVVLVLTCALRTDPSVATCGARARWLRALRLSRKLEWRDEMGCGAVTQ